MDARIEQLIIQIKKNEINNPQVCFKDAIEIYQYAKTYNYTRYIVLSLFYLGCCKRRLDDLQNAEKYLIKALKYLENMEGSEIKVEIYNELSKVYCILDNYQLSYDYIYKANEIALEIRNYKLIGEINYNIGELFKKVEDYDTSLKYYFKSKKIYIDYIEKDPYKYCLILLNIGEVYNKIGKLAAADKYLKKGLKMSNKINFSFGQCKYYINKFTLYYVNNNLLDANYCVDQGIKIAKLMNYNRFYIELLLEKSMLSRSNALYKDENKYLNEALEIAKTNKLYYYIKIISPSLAKSYEELDETEEAYKVYKNYCLFRVKLTQIENQIIRLSLISQTEIGHNNLKLKEKYKNRKKLLRVLENANHNLMMLSNTDELTNLYNKRFLKEFIKKIITKPNDSDNVRERLSILFIDIDYFKEYNDNYGHNQGDNCIREVAKAIANVVNIENSENFIARYGGDEFIAIIRNATDNESVKFAQHLREKIESLQIEHSFSKVSNFVTVSIGLAIVPVRSIENVADVFIIADHALYRAKRNGKNQIAQIIEE